jgi:hypothetical protein
MWHLPIIHCRMTNGARMWRGISGTVNAHDLVRVDCSAVSKQRIHCQANPEEMR